MIKVYRKRYVTGWYTDMMGRRRPITKTGIVIELPPEIFMKKRKQLKKNVSVELSIRIDGISLKDLEEIGFKIIEMEINGEKEKAIETEDGLKMLAHEIHDGDDQLVYLTVYGKITDLTVFRKVVEAYRKTVEKILEDS